MRDFQHLQNTRRIADEALFRSAKGSGPSSKATQIIYANKGGSDSTGTGSILAPYLTISKALSSATDASISKVYLVLVGPGEYDENVEVVPFVDVFAEDNSITAIAGAVSLSPSWPPSLSEATVDGFAFEQDVSLAFTNDNQVVTFQSCYFAGAFTVTGSPGQPELILTDCFVTNAGSFSGLLLFSRRNVFLSGFAISSSATEPAEWESFADDVVSSTSVTSVGQNCAAIVLGTQVSGTLNLTGAGSSYQAAAGGVPPTVVLVGGAPAPVLLTQGNGLGYAPASLPNWSGTAPPNMSNAIDRLAAKVGPVP